MSEITPKVRAELAEMAGISDQYLYQCLSGRRDMDATEAVRVEKATGNKVRRWNLRRDWHLTWPELIDAVGAPAVPESSHAEHKAAA